MKKATNPGFRYVAAVFRLPADASNLHNLVASQLLGRDVSTHLQRCPQSPGTWIRIGFILAVRRLLASLGFDPAHRSSPLRKSAVLSITNGKLYSRLALSSFM